MNRPTTAPPPANRPSPPPPPTQRTQAASAATAAPIFTNAPAEWQPPRLGVSAVEGWGKTTVAAYGPRPAILMAGGETGYETLLGAGLVPQVDRVKLETWAETTALLDSLAANGDEHGLCALDALSGFERQCHQYVCDRDFGGDWGEKGFASYQKGYEVALGEWLLFLQRLDRLRTKTGAIILVLSHCKVKTFKNPLGPDYDRWACDVHDKTWAATAKWLDAVLFGQFLTIVEGGSVGDRAKKGKVLEGEAERVLYCQRTDAWDAKNRYGMPPRLEIPNNPAAVWQTIWTAISGGKDRT